MKKIRLFVIGLLMMFILPVTVCASSANISVSASNTVMLGNTVTVTVKLSSSSNIGSWQMDLSYDRNLLELTKSTAESGGTAMASSSAGGTKSVSYNFTFKTKKSGSARVSVSSYLVYDYNSMEQMSVSSGSASINIKTKEEIEASYSANAYLESLSVVGYGLEFKKDTYEYTVEVENDVETVTINASKEDYRSSVSGTGEITLVEGNNKVEITVTAQKGNTLTYTVNVYRKELDPILVDFNGSEYTVVRKLEELKEYNTFTTDTVRIEEFDVPAYKSVSTGITILGLKDSDGKVIMVIYEDGKYVREYVEVKGTSLTVIPLELKEKESLSKYIKKTVDITGYKVDAYLLKKSSNVYVFYGQEVISGDKNYYRYNAKDESIQLFDEELDDFYKEQMEKIKYVVYGLIGLVILLLLIVIFRKPKNKKDKKNKEKDFDEDLYDEDALEDEEEVEEEKDEDLEEEAEEYNQEEIEREKEELRKEQEKLNKKKEALNNPKEEEEEEEIEPKSIDEVIKSTEVVEETEEVEEEEKEVSSKKKTKEDKKRAKEDKKRQKKEAKEAKRKAKNFDWE